MSVNIKDNYKSLKEEVANACNKSNRNISSVKIIAATKTVSVENIEVAINAGIVDLGENRLQEALPKLEQIDHDVVWHFIGHLQRNKAKQVVGKFDLIHAIDSFKLLEKINQLAEGLNIIQQCLLSVNIAGEDSKFGLSKEEAIEVADKTCKFDNLQITGLMTMPPYSSLPDKNRRHFAELIELGNKINSHNNNIVNIKDFSMGMSSDFQVAIQEGATMIRCGSILFGKREKM